MAIAYKDGTGCLLSPDFDIADVKPYRESLGMTQEDFAKEFNVPLGTLRRWEQGQNYPSRSAWQLFLIKAQPLLTRFKRGVAS